MHELSIAMSIVDLVEEESERRGRAVEAVHLRLGRLSGVVAGALESSYRLATEGTPLSGSRLVIEDVPVVVFCAACDARRPIQSLMDFRCVECGTPTADVVEGRELTVTALELRA